MVNAGIYLKMEFNIVRRVLLRKGILSQDAASTGWLSCRGQELKM